MRYKRSKLRSTKGASEISQFPLALYCMFLVLLLPLLNLVTLLVAGSTVYLATNDLAAKAATQPSFDKALNTMAGEAYNLQSNSLCKFVKMTPQAGYLGCGNDLYVLATNIGGSGTQTSSADNPLTLPIDSNQNVYEMQVKSSYFVQPLISMGALPLLGDIPGLGKPVLITLNAQRPIEHPGGMQISSANNTGGSISKFPRIAQSQNTANTPPVSPTAWRTPNIFDLINQAGQTVVSTNVLIVDANHPWQGSGITPLPGQQVWIDTSAVGTWGDIGATSDANGSGAEPCYPNISVDVAPGGQIWELLGFVGNPPAITSGMNGFTDPNMFYVGNTLLNYKLPSSGNLSFMINDSRQNTTYNNQTLLVGQQLVRIIVTR